jgi:cytochrome c-type biogenesis protein CcmH/NrfG
MGLLTGLLTLPLAPLRGTAWVVDQVIAQAEREAYDPEPVLRRLAALERDLVEGRIDEEEFDAREDELLDRLDRLEARRSGAVPPPEDHEKSEEHGK